jgi:hypothetical protein
MAEPPGRLSTRHTDVCKVSRVDPDSPDCVRCPRNTPNVRHGLAFDFRFTAKRIIDDKLVHVCFLAISLDTITTF